ncbi:hypothetical protein O181_010469 [Austropuccinia psidii MF-1]|uniref:Uncharacterized protein n=1 Tax=Austropuccinia psidii MF-1 TaxID=1389203 RepID=A0A9Q3GKV8_9BASI|nr:hypothetical protein [Austropuccinia psidii MF-1]
MRYSFLGHFTITRLVGNNSVEVRHTEESSRKHLVFQVSLLKPYQDTGEDKFPPKIKTWIPPDIVEVENLPVPVKRIIQCRKIIINGNDHQQFLVRLTNQASDKEKSPVED